MVAMNGSVSYPLVGSAMYIFNRR